MCHLVGGACKTLNGGAVSLSPCFTSHFDFKCIQASGIQIKKEKSTAFLTLLDALISFAFMSLRA